MVQGALGGDLGTILAPRWPGTKKNEEVTWGPLPPEPSLDSGGLSNGPVGAPFLFDSAYIP